MISSSSQEEKSNRSSLSYKSSPIQKSSDKLSKRNRSSSCDEAKIHPLALRLTRYSSSSESNSSTESLGKKKKKKKKQGDKSFDIEEITIEDDKPPMKKGKGNRKEETKVINNIPMIPVTPSSFVPIKNQLSIPPTSSYSDYSNSGHCDTNRLSINLGRENKGECDYSSSIDETKDKKLRKSPSLSNLNYTSITKKTIIENQSELCQYNRLLGQKIIENQKEIEELRSIIREMKNEQKNIKRIDDNFIIRNEEENGDDSDESNITYIYDTLFCLNQDKCSLF